MRAMKLKHPERAQIAGRAGVVLVIAAAAVTLAGCAAGHPSSAPKVAEAFYNAALDGEYAKACALAVDSDGKPLQTGDQDFASCVVALDQQRLLYTVGYGIDSVTVETADVDGDSATVTLGDIKGLPEAADGESFSFFGNEMRLVKTGDKWFVGSAQ